MDLNPLPTPFSLSLPVQIIKTSAGKKRLRELPGQQTPRRDVFGTESAKIPRGREKQQFHGKSATKGALLG